MVKYILKAGKDTYEIQQNQTETFEDFQAKVFALTDIPPKNLKVLFKAKMIKDTKSLLQVAEGSALIVMGTKSGKELKQSEATIQIATVEVTNKLPTRYGLTNLGNTCYLNSAVQLLKSVPQLRSLIKNYNPKNNSTNNSMMDEGNINKAIISSLSKVFEELDKKDLKPLIFFQLFLNSHPEYLPVGTQHDSDQFLHQILRIISMLLSNMNRLFEIEFVDTSKNLEIEQQAKVEVSKSMKLCCSIGGVEKELKIGTLTQGIKLSLETKLTKISQIDGINHLYQKITRFNSLPEYMFVQMVRFFWKKADDLPHSKPVAAKICKSIEFSQKLDIFQFCTDDLKKKLQVGRDAVQENRIRDQAEYKAKYQEFKKSLGQTNRPQTRIIEEFKEKWKKSQSPLREGLQTGYYELTGVITHLGNSVQSGHYMAWIKQNDEEWTKYDDDTVYQQSVQKVGYLRGGQPNLQIAYVLLYRKVYVKPL